MPDEVAERTQAPTSRKREQARRDGVVARSPDFGGGAVILASMAMLALCGAKIFTTLQTLLAQALGSTEGISSKQSVITAAKSLAPVIVVIFLAAIAAQIFQVGFHFDAARLSPSFGRSRKKMFQANRLPNGIINVIKLLLVTLLAWSLVKVRIERIASLQTLPLSDLVDVAFRLIYEIAIRLAIFLLAIGALDYAYRRYRMEKQLMMTPRELKQEQRLTEGDPKIKARRRAIAMKQAKQRLGI